LKSGGRAYTLPAALDATRYDIVPALARAPLSMKTPASRSLLLALLLCTILGSSWMPTKISSPNERTRVYLAHAIVTRGELQVTPEWERWGQIFDIAHYKDQFYSDKAPGASLLAVPVIAAYRQVNPDYTIEDLVLICRRLVLLVTLLGVIALMRALQLLKAPEPAVAIAAVALTLGSNIIHYGHSFFGHGLVLSCILCSFWGILAAQRAQGRGADMRWMLAGLASGLAFTVEYQGALVTIAMLAGLVADPQTRSPRALALFIAGVIPPVLLTLGYNYMAFDNPFTTSYNLLYFKVSQQVHERGAWGISLPTMTSTSGVLFSPSRGLLFSCPALLLGLSLRREDYVGPRWLNVAALSLAAAFLYVITSFGVWQGGWGQGARIFIPALAPLALLLGLRIPHMSLARRSVMLSVGAISILSNLAIKLTFAETPPEVVVPLRTSALPLLRQHIASPALFPYPLITLGLVAALLIAALVLLHRRSPLTLSRRLILPTIAAWLLLMWAFPETDANLHVSHPRFVAKLVKPGK
jgi:hypothetical protein